MLQTKGYAAKAADAGFQSFEFERREVGADDILIEIKFCGVCHSDIHQVRNEWGNAVYPMVPGHEIVGRVAKTGANVTKFKEGDLAGIGCFTDSCGDCANCADDAEQMCLVHTVMTYNGTEMDKATRTFGGYSNQIVIGQDYALKINAPEDQLAGVAPLLCAGITTYSPLKKYNVGENSKVGIVGLGGLGHMGVKLAAAMGAEVTVFSTSPDKEEDAKKLGAHHFVFTKGTDNLKKLGGQFDFILDCVSAPHDINEYLNLLRRNGALVLVGAPEKPLEVSAFSIIPFNRTLAGSMIGGIKETQEMLDYCAEKNITSDIELINIQDLENAYERTVKGDVRYRFVIDLSSLNQAS